MAKGVINVFRLRCFILFILCFWLTYTGAQAKEYDVGGGKNHYSTMAELTSSIRLASGSTVNIYPGTYTDTWNISNAKGTAAQPITIRGVNADGNPITSPQETCVFDFASNTSKLTAINIYGSSSWITIQGLAFKNATRTTNMKVVYGDVFRVWASGTVTFRYILFKNNTSTTGAKLGNNKMIVEYCEFSEGTTTHSNPHMLYSIAGKHLVVQHCYFHDYNSSRGSVIKTRDRKADILYNYIDMGTAKGGIDACHFEKRPITNQHTNVIGNIFIKSTDDGDGWAQSFVKHSHDNQKTPRPGKATIINNTFIDLTGTIEGAINLTTSSGNNNEVSNNIFFGITDLTSGGNDDTLAGKNNWIPSGVDVEGLVDSVQGTDPGFVGKGDYRLSLTSPCIDAGYGSASIQPAYQYAGTANRKERLIYGRRIDIGAYESAGNRSQKGRIKP